MRCKVFCVWSSWTDSLVALRTHLLASSLQLVSMSRTSSSLASDRVSYGSSASKSECPRQQVLGEASVWCGLVDCQPKNSSKCKRGTGSTATAGIRRSIAGLASDARCAGSSRSSVVLAAPRALVIMSGAGSSCALARFMVTARSRAMRSSCRGVTPPLSADSVRGKPLREKPLRLAQSGYSGIGVSRARGLRLRE